MRRTQYLVASLIIIGIIAFGLINYKKANYVVPVNLTQEERADYEAKIVEANDKIKAVKAPERPDIDYFIDKARFLEYLGRYSDAINTLLDSLKYYENTSVGWNNLAKLYEKVGDYKSAIFFYGKLVDVFSMNRYYLDIAWDYYRIGKLDLAREAYGRFAQITMSKDIELYNLLYVK
mgnify:CR=1 FL=1